MKRIQATIIAGLLLLMLILPQLALAAGQEIFDVDVENITFTTATITWTTNTTSDSRVNYGTDRPKDGTWKSVQDSAEVNFHSILLQNLTPGTTYYFEVADVSGTTIDNNGGEYYSFKILAWYSITLDHACGVCGELVEPGICGELIEVTAIVAEAGTYHVCWDSRIPWDPSELTGARDTFTATGAGSHTLVFYAPEAAKGIHTVYLTDSTYAEKAKATFEVRPSVKIDPEKGPVGTAVTVNCYGFAASQDIQVNFLDTVQTVQANTWGSWTGSLTIPATPAGSYTFCVEAKEGTVFVCWVKKDFTVMPEITASSSSGTVGETVEVKGTGFKSKEKDIEVTFDGEVGETNTPIVADEKGSWTAVIVVPLLQKGIYTISASGELTRARDVTGIKDFAVGAGVLVELVEQRGPYVGDTIIVKGGGFATGETGIRVYFDGAPVTPAFTAKGDGTWETSFVLPASSYGSHPVGASGTITTAVTTTLNTQARIIEISPDRGAPGDIVSLTGDGFGSSKQLTVRIGGIAASDPMQTLSNGNVAVSFHVPKDSPEGTLQLDVTDGEATDSGDFTVTKKTLSTTPLPISPRGSTLRSGVVTFRWQGVPSGTDFTYTYTLEISQTAGAGSFWSLANISTNNYTWAENDPLDKGTYYWRVKMVDNYGNEGAWSDPVEFRVSPIPIWVWVVVGVVVLVGLMVVAYRETKFKVTE
ncbi:MAG: fibronectin type III domain-containing protein [Dehalococcoidia bacterium]